MSTLRDELLTLARANGWEEQSGNAFAFYNLALYRPVGDQRECLELRFLNDKLTAVQHRHPAHEPRKITLRKVDHVHALLRARSMPRRSTSASRAHARSQASASLRLAHLRGP